jgi:hypothetical protein
MKEHLLDYGHEVEYITFAKLLEGLGINGYSLTSSMRYIASVH